MSNKFSFKDKLFISYALIAVATAIVYFPSLTHMPRSDQLVYLANISHQQDWISLAVKNYSYNRMSLTYGYGGDTLLFRPLYFMFLGTQKWLFGYHFALWQLTGILCHLIVIRSLLTLLQQIHKSFAAVLLAAYFATSFALVDMVIWSCTTSYMVCFACLLSILKRIQKIIKNGYFLPKDLFFIFLLSLAAVFIYEPAMAICFLYALYFLISFKPHPADKTSPQGMNKTNASRKLTSKIFTILSLCVPSILYMISNFADITLRNVNLQTVNRGVFQWTHVLTVAPNVLKSFLWWGYLGLFPTQAVIFPVQRHITSPSYIDTGRLFADPIRYTVIFGIGLALCYLVIVIRKDTLKHIQKQWRFIILLCCMILAYGSIIALGRINVKGLVNVLSDNPYYAYFFWLLLVLIIYSLIPFDFFNQHQAFRPLKLLAKVLLIIAICHNMVITQEFNTHVKKLSYYYRTLHVVMKKLIRKEKHFTVNMDRKLDGGFYFAWIHRRETPNRKGTHYLELLYPQYYDEENPTHHLTVDNKGYWKIIKN